MGAAPEGLLVKKNPARCAGAPGWRFRIRIYIYVTAYIRITDSHVQFIDTPAPVLILSLMDIDSSDHVDIYAAAVTAVGPGRLA